MSKQTYRHNGLYTAS